MKRTFYISLTIFILFFLLVNDVNSQCAQGAVTTFQKVYGSFGSERGHSVVSTTDGGYALVGETTSSGAGSIDMFVSKVDATGNQQWSYTYGGGSMEDGNSMNIIQTMDGGYLISGHTTSFGGGNNGYLLKLGVTGIVQWDKVTAGTTIRHTTELSNGDFVINGNSYNFGPGIIASYVMRVNPLGVVLWSRGYGGAGVDQSTCVMETPSGDMIITSHTTSFGVGGTDGTLLRIDNTGNIVWAKYYGGPITETYYATSMLSDGNMIAVGLTNSFGLGSEDVLLSKIDLNGNILWSRTFGGGGTDIGEYALENLSGEIIISGYTNSFGGGFDMLLFSTDLNGNLIWSKSYGGGATDQVDRWSKPFDITMDNGIVMVGGTNSFGVGSEDIYLIKTNQCGESFCNESNINLQTTTPNIVVGIAAMTFGSGGSYPALNTVSSPTNYTTTTMCIDSITSCNITPNFVSANVCLGDSSSFFDTSIDSLGNIIDWKWYFGDGDSTIGVSNPVHFYGTSGNFTTTLVVINDSNCIDSISITFTVDSVQQQNIGITICPGDSLFVGGEFQQVAGVYVDTLIANNGCDSLVLTTLSVNPVYNINQNISICSGESILLGGSFQTSSGIYIDVFQSINGCDSNVTTNLSVKISPDVIAYSDTTIEKGEVVQLNASGAITYIWSPDFELSCTNCQAPYASPTLTTNYIVEGFVNGCSSFDTITITVNKTEVFIYIPNTFTPNFDGKNDIFYFYAEGFREFEAQIFNRWGELLYESVDILEGWNAKYKGKDVPLGVYVYRVKIVSFDNQYFRKVGSINVIR